MSTHETTSAPPGESRASEVKAAAAEQSGQVARTAKEQARTVASEAMTQTRRVADEARGRVQGEVSVQRDRLADTLQQVAEDLDRMVGSGGGSETTNRMVQQVAGQVRTLSTWTRERDGGSMDEVRAFARNRPMVFIGTAVALGVLAGRATRGLKEASGSGDTGTGYAEQGYADTGYGDGGYPDTGYAEAGYTGAVGSAAAAGAAGMDPGYGQGTESAYPDPREAPFPGAAPPAYTEEDLGLPPERASDVRGMPPTGVTHPPVEEEPVGVDETTAWMDPDAGTREEPEDGTGRRSAP
jgi:hypothetical protein